MNTYHIKVEEISRVTHIVTANSQEEAEQMVLDGETIASDSDSYDGELIILDVTEQS